LEDTNRVNESSKVKILRDIMASFAPHQFPSIAPEYDEVFQFRGQNVLQKLSL
jgi:hypothetical protein